MKKSILILIVLGIGVSGLLLISKITKGQESKQQDLVDDTTPITLGVMTIKQQKHSELYSKNKGQDLINGEDEVETIFTKPYGSSSIPGEPLSNKINRFQKKVCNSDTVVIATVESKTSQITEDRTFIFTDYELKITDVINNRSYHNLEVFKKIDLTTPGGSVKVNNRVISVKLQSNKRLQKNKTYLFLLKYLTESDSFQLTDMKSVFDIRENKIIRGEKDSYPFEKEDETINSAKTFFIDAINDCP